MFLKKSIFRKNASLIKLTHFIDFISCFCGCQ